MLSPKMQRTIRVNDSQLAMLSERAHFDHSLAGYLHKRTADNTKWQLRWFVLYQIVIECCIRALILWSWRDCHCMMPQNCELVVVVRVSLDVV
ncbi:hypothetical protein PR048_018793 [Dryococelus australis]|uniref:Uncharacterized protein n=1 Tax=Dryococelus australis TaxID=614101 RepID=A0ABQ9H1R8_9NEOP|nr:hypothetical protein PR048_018793 [Dryococelus australis]